MNNKITRKEAENLLKELVALRRKIKRTSDPQVHNAYQQSRKRCMDRFDFLIESKTRKYYNFANYEDLKQDGRIALMYALNSYEPRKGNFFWWADKYIKTKVCREANRHSTIRIPLKHTKRLQPYKVSQLPTIIDGGLDGFELLDKRQTRDRVQAAIKKLPSEQREVIKLYFEMGGSKIRSINKICKQLKISRINFWDVFNKAKETLKLELERFENDDE